MKTYNQFLKESSYLFEATIKKILKDKNILDKLEDKLDRDRVFKDQLLDDIDMYYQKYNNGQFNEYFSYYIYDMMKASLQSHFEDDLNDDPPDDRFIEHIHKKYGEWILFQYIKTDMLGEDIYKYGRFFYYFEKYPHRFSQRDINRYDYRSFMDESIEVIRRFKSHISIELDQDGIEMIEQDIKEGNIELVYPRRLNPNVDYYILQINDTNAAIKYGCDSYWCISRKDNGMYEYYTRNSYDGVFYFLFINGVQKFAYYYDKKLGLQFFNQHDHEISYNIDRHYPFMKQHLKKEYLTIEQKLEIFDHNEILDILKYQPDFLPYNKKRELNAFYAISDKEIEESDMNLEVYSGVVHYRFTTAIEIYGSVPQDIRAKLLRLHNEHGMNDESFFDIKDPKFIEAGIFIQDGMMTAYADIKKADFLSSWWPSLLRYLVSLI